MEIFTAVLPMILEPIVSPIKRRVAYVFQFRSQVNTFGDQVKLLELERDSLQCSVEDARRRGEEVETHVLGWQTRADTAIAEAQVLVRNGEEEAQKGCCSLRLTTRYRMAKTAAQATPGIVQLLEEKSRLGSKISHRADLQQIVGVLPVEGYKAQSRTKILDQVMGALLDPSVTMVGVHGMGGIGKTTLVEEVQRQVMQKSSFDKVVMVMVTATPDIKKIQDVIAEFVTGSKLEESTDATRASRLHQILKDRKVVIILDDLWNLLELEKVGIPSWNDNKGGKILLTSRNEDILTNMGSRKNFRLEFLSEEESMSLFEKKVIKFEYPEIAKTILAKCVGYPLLIVTVGGPLRNKGLHVWKNALTQLSKFEDGEVVKKVHSILESSYDNLEDNKTKQIFLLIGISSQLDTTMLNLPRYGLGLGFFKDYTVCEARNHLKTLIDDLKACSLLDVDKKGNVKMHYIVRETAIQIAHRNKYAFRVRDDKVLAEWPSRCVISGCTIVSIPQNNDIRQLPKDLGCPCIEFLLLFSNWHSVDIQDSTFEGTAKLKVIHFARMELASLPVGPSHSLANLHTLCLEDCHLLNLTTIGQLETLEILNFRGSDLEALPSEIENLTRMKVLDLSGCSKLSFIPVGVISKLTSLEELLMRNSFENWEIEGVTGGSNARLSELKCLPRLESLEIRVPDIRALSKDLFSNHLERFQILIGRRVEFDHCSEMTKILKLVIDTSTDLLQKVRELLKDSESLYLRFIMGSTSHLYDLEKEGFPKLKELYMTDSNEFQQVVDCRKRRPTVCFPLLESLELSILTRMVTICQGLSAPGSFGQMKRLKISDCNNLKHLFSLSTVRSLPQLEEIHVRSCSEIEALFIVESDCIDVANEVVEFPRLRCLNLDRLPQLKCFLYAREKPIGSGMSETAKVEIMPFFNDKVALPSMETLEIRWMNCVEMIWCSKLPSAFNKLNSLEIWFCDKLLRVFSSDSFERFQNLKSLSVHRCKAMEEIYQFGDGFVVGVPNDDPMILGLNELKLSYLPRLKRIWKEDSTGRYCSFHNLESTSISDCESLENVFPPAVAKTLSQLKRLEVSSCGNLEVIVEAAEKELSNDRSCSVFPRLTSFKIVECPKANIFGGAQPHFPNQQPFFSLEKVVPNLKEMCTDGRIFKSMSSKYLIGLESLELSLIRGGTLVEVAQLENIPLLKKFAISYSHITKLCRTIDVGEPSTSTSISSSSSIRFLELQIVHRLRHMWRRDSQMDPLLPYLEILKLYACYDLISLASSPSASFWSLTTLELSSCWKLTDLLNPTTARTMASLVTLKISQCGALKEIVAAEDDRTTRECIVFNKLKTLKLSYLGSLQGFCISGSYSFNFPCLEVVSVEGCRAMRIFCNGGVDTPKLRNVESLRLWGRDLNTIIKLLYEDGIQSIEYQRLSRFPELVETWGRELSPLNRFSRIHELVVDQLPLLLPVAIPSNVLPALSGLIVLVVEKCDYVEEIFDMDGMKQQSKDHVTFMPELRRLELVELPKLRHVWNVDFLGVLGLENLSVLKIHNCGNLTHIFTLSVALALVHLESLYVTECPLVEVIIKQQSDEQLPADWDHRAIFPLLHPMQLENLPSMMDFFSGDDVLRCPNLKRVLVESCPRMCLLNSTAGLLTEEDESIIVQRGQDRALDGDVHEPTVRILNKQVEISRLKELTCQWNSSMDNAWHEIVPQSFLHSLEVVKLTGYPTHHELLPSDFVQSMPNLQKFTIVDSFCKQLLPRSPAVSFNKLTCLKLFNLPELYHLVEEDSQSGTLFQHLKVLQVSKCKRLTRLVTSTTAKGLVDLQELTVEECERMTEVVSSNGDEVGGVEIVFQKLKSLELHCLPCLASFSSGNCTFSFPHLGMLKVSRCKRLTRLVTSTTAKGLVDLQELTVEECERMTEVVSSNGDEVGGVEIVFQKLKSLELHCLPCLASFSSGNCTFSFPHLGMLKVSRCKRLTRLVTSTTAKGLVDLLKLTVEECERMTEVVSSNGDEVGGVEIVFQDLKSLELHGLPCLASFSSGNCTFSFPRLDEVVVRECPNMKTFAKNAQSAPKLYYVRIAGEDEDDDDDVDPWRLVEDGLNGTIEKLFAEMNPGSIC